MSSNGLDRLAEASSLTDTLRSIQRDMQVLREDVNHLKANDSASRPPRSGDGRTQEGITSRSDIHDPTDRIPGTSWAEEMDILDPILEERGDAARIVEVTPCTEACIKASFQSMSNAAWRSLRSKFILPKVSATITPCLDKV